MNELSQEHEEEHNLQKESLKERYCAKYMDEFVSMRQCSIPDVLQNYVVPFDLYIQSNFRLMQDIARPYFLCNHFFKNQVQIPTLNLILGYVRSTA